MEDAGSGAEISAGRWEQLLTDRADRLSSARGTDEDDFCEVIIHRSELLMHKSVWSPAGEEKVTSTCWGSLAEVASDAADPRLGRAIAQVLVRSTGE
jgi:hypothetical protein